LKLRKNIGGDDLEPNFDNNLFNSIIKKFAQKEKHSEKSYRSNQKT